MLAKILLRQLTTELSISALQDLCLLSSLKAVVSLPGLPTPTKKKKMLLTYVTWKMKSILHISLSSKGS